MKLNSIYTKNNIELYFAHNFNHRLKYRLVETHIESIIPIKLFNPFYDDPNRANEMVELDKSGKVYGTTDKSNSVSYYDIDWCEHIVKRDLEAIVRCDGLFTIIDEPSIGTMIEICTTIQMHKPVFVVTDKYSNHPWLRVYAEKIFKDVDSFIEFWK